MGATVQQPRIVSSQDDNFIEFKLKMEQNNIPGGQSNEISVCLMIKIKSDQIFQEIQMQNKGLFENGFIFQHNMKIQKNEEYQYKYKVNSEYEKEIRRYKYDSDLEMGVDEWDKIWVGYRLNYQDKKLQQQLNQENFKLVENINIQEGLEIQMKKGQTNENKKSMNEIVIRSNYLMFQFSDDLIYRWLQNSIAEVDQEIHSIIKNNQNNVLKELTINVNELEKEIQGQSTFRILDIRTNLETLKKNQLRIIQHFFNEQLNNRTKSYEIKEYQSKNNVKQDENIDQKKELQQQIQLQKQKYETYTKNLNTILEKLISETDQISNKRIVKLLAPIEIPQIKDSVFEKCAQSLTILNNKLKDLKQNNQLIQDQYEPLKIACEESIQKLDDYELTIQQKDERYQLIIQKLRKELLKKKDKIKKLQEKQKNLIFQILEANAKYYKDIQELQQKEIDLIESQKEEKMEILDKSLQIKLLEIERSKLRDLIKVKDAFILNQCNYVTTLLQQIQTYKEQS